MRKKFFPAILIAAFLLISGKIEEDKPELKKIEKSMVKVSENLYACKYEAANLEYRIFLNELKANKPNNYKIAMVDSEQWQKRFPHAYHDPLVQMYCWHPAYNYYPVVNISHEGAVMFCTWLTEKYNSWKGKNFKKIKFRLPSSEEWELAARGGKEDENYPFGNYLRGETGKYLCNYRPVGDEKITSDIDSNKMEVVKKFVKTNEFMADGATYTTRVNSYFPNGFGLYNMSGNVAEMLIEDVVVCGGSWANSGFDVRIDSRQKFDKPSPLVGFRYFMEVIEK